MKTLTFAGVALATLIFSGAALADDYCNDPVTNWQPRETLRLQLEQRGWTIQRIKVDDGCYEVKGMDKAGNQLKAKFAPASLQVRKLEVKFEQGVDASPYLGQMPVQKTK